jgi:hypothetical protein
MLLLGLWCGAGRGACRKLLLLLLGPLCRHLLLLLLLGPLCRHLLLLLLLVPVLGKPQSRCCCCEVQGRQPPVGLLPRPAASPAAAQRLLSIYCCPHSYGRRRHLRIRTLHCCCCCLLMCQSAGHTT